jgi:hypothetical protein
MAGEQASAAVCYCSCHFQFSEAQFSLNEVEWFCALWNEAFLQSFNAVFAFKKCFVLYEQ